jgi:hypothetical protein
VEIAGSISCLICWLPNSLGAEEINGADGLLPAGAGKINGALSSDSTTSMTKLSSQILK